MFASITLDTIIPENLCSFIITLKQLCLYFIQKEKVLLCTIVELFMYNNFRANKQEKRLRLMYTYFLC